MKIERAPLPVVIARLARDGAPVTPLPSPLARWGLWTLKAAVAAAIVTIVLGLRPDLAAYLRTTRFMLGVSAIAILAVTAAGNAFLLSVPGAASSRAARVLPLIAMIAWAVLLWTRLVAIGHPVAEIVATPRHPACVLIMLTIGAIPGIWLFDMLRRAAPLEARWTAVYAALGALACGALGTQFVCPIDAPGHQLLWHFVPTIALTSIGLLLAGTFRRLP